MENGFGFGGAKRQRETGNFERLSFGKNDGTLNNVFEFANISRPIVAIERRQDGGSETLHILFENLRILLKKMVSQEGDVVATVAQRRKMKFDDIQAVV